VRGGKKVPMLIHLRTGAPMALAGIYDVWRPPEGGEVESFAILTTGANELMVPIHDRMPVIIGREDRARWLDPDVQDGSELAPLLRSYPAGEMEAFEVSSAVNSPANDYPELAEPVHGRP
jgi:putative SOS response-associated peptidase YedK